MFKKALLLAAILVGSWATVDSVSAADTYVRGYYRSNGSYVMPHYRTRADSNFYNNYSTYPNVNPYTGRTGTRRTPSYSSPTYRSYSYPSYRSSSPYSYRSSSYWSW